MSGLCRSGARLFINTFGILCDLLARSGIVWAKGPGSEESGVRSLGLKVKSLGVKSWGLRMRSLVGMNPGLLACG